jgi:hypothetical protein
VKNQVTYLGVILDEKLNWNSHIDHKMWKATIETKGCVLDIHFGGETHFDLRCLTVVAKSVQISVNWKTAHLQPFACINITGSMHSDPTAALEVILMLLALGIYIEGEAKQATYRLNCSGEFTRARFGHSKDFKKMTNELPSLLAQGDKIVPIISLEEGF